ncbi:MAG: GbsR/MarR family transcriptional regulator [bacterium]
MQKDSLENKIQQLAESVGEFIKYWGFKEIHGRVWVHIYLSNQPITAKELTRKLGVTKGLISMTLSELIAYQVIEKVNIGNAKSPGYQSNTDLVEVIYNVLRNRELKLTTKIQENIDSLLESIDKEDRHSAEKLKRLHEMTGFAIESLKKLLENKVISTDRFKLLMKLIS